MLGLHALMLFIFFFFAAFFRHCPILKGRWFVCVCYLFGFRYFCLRLALTVSQFLTHFLWLLSSFPLNHTHWADFSLIFGRICGWSFFVRIGLLCFCVFKFILTRGTYSNTGHWTHCFIRLFYVDVNSFLLLYNVYRNKYLICLWIKFLDNYGFEMGPS